MEAVSAAFGIVAAIPQCIEAAKQLYDLRERYKDASVLITAIYSESMVIAASLSQVQNLLQRDALQNKPELHETFDQALTGCRVVYTCLEEEVRDLVAKANNNDLGFRDRTKFIWKEETFKELLQQIRGQQSALSLLIQGLQMQSIADIKRLVQDNSDRLDQVAKRSKTLRQKHPQINVPDTIFDNYSTNSQSLSDAQSILSSAEFAFDEEVINSKAYRRAMALATVRADAKEPVPEPVQGDLINLDTPDEKGGDGDLDVPAAISEIKSLNIEPKSTIDESNGAIDTTLANQETEPDGHADLLDALEKSMLPFMPPVRTDSPKPTITTKVTPSFRSVRMERTEEPKSAASSIPNIQSSFLITEDTEFDTTAKDYEVEQEPEKPPPLPPRRPILPQAEVTKRPISDDSASTLSDPSMISRSSTTSSRTLFDPLQDNSLPMAKVQRKPLPTLPLSHKKSWDILSQASPETEAFISLTEDAEMHDIWAALITEEERFIDRITKFRKIFYESVVKEWPALQKHLGAIAVTKQMARLHQQHLLRPMKSHVSQEEDAACNPAIFEFWAGETYKLYRDYAQTMPHAESSLRLTQNIDAKFTQFVGKLGLSIIWFGKGWEDFLALPTLQLNLYVEKLTSLIKRAETLDMSSSRQDESLLKSVRDTLERLNKSYTRTIEEARKREAVQTIHRRMQALNISVSQLNLAEPGRRVIHQGGLAIKVNGQGSWQGIHAVLLDNYLLWGKVRPPRAWKHQERKGDNIWVMENPIPVSELEAHLPQNRDQFQRAAFLDEIPRGLALYEIFVKNSTWAFKSHTLGAYSPAERQEWFDHLKAAVDGKRSSSSTLVSELPN